MTNFKKVSYISLATLLLASLGGSLWLYKQIPFGEIDRISSGSSVQVNFDKESQKVSYEITDKENPHWVKLEEVSKNSYQAIIISEDWSFFDHSGVDYKQVTEAIEESLIEGKKPRGASTITQQVVKNLFFSSEYSLTRKVKEAITASVLEKKLTKEEILEVYLNIAEFGPGIYGISQASKHYFNKGPRELNAREGAFLAMLLPSPKGYQDSFKKKELTDFAKETVDEILVKMKVAGYLNPEQLEEERKSKFSWEEKEQKKQKRKATEDKVRKRQERLHKESVKKKVSNGYDPELIIEDNPEFSDDALVEGLAGIEEEFFVQ